MVYTGIPIGVQSSHERSSAPIFFSIFDDKRSTSVVTTINFSSSFSTSSFDFSSFMACCLTPHRGTEKSQRQLTATCLNKGIAIQFLTLPHLPPPSFKGAPRFIECRRLILWHKQSTRCEVSSFISILLYRTSYTLRLISLQCDGNAGACWGSAETFFSTDTQLQHSTRKTTWQIWGKKREPTWKGENRSSFYSFYIFR